MPKDHNVPFIYESPDGGKTLFRRQFGDHSTMEQIPTEEDKKQARIKEHCKKLDTEMLKWEKESYYNQFRQEEKISRKERDLDPDPEARCFYQLHP